MDRETQVYCRFLAGKFREVTKDQLVYEQFNNPDGMRQGLVYARASMCKKTRAGWRLKVYPLPTFKSKWEHSKDFEEINKHWWVVPVADEDFKNIKTSCVVGFPQLLEAYWKQFPKSDTIWGVLDAAQPLIRDMALIVGNLAYDQQWRKKVKALEFNPFFGAKNILRGKEKEYQDFIEYTRKFVFNYMMSGAYGRQVHNPDMMWQISTNMLTSPSFYGYHTTLSKTFGTAAKNYLQKLPVTKNLTEFMYKRMPHKLAYLFKTTEDFEASKIVKAVLDEIDPVVGKNTLAGIVNKKVLDGRGLKIMSERTRIREVINKVQEALEPAYAKIPEVQKKGLLEFYKTGKGVLGKEAEAFHLLARSDFEKLSGRFILDPKLIPKVKKIFSEVYRGGDKTIPENLIESARLARTWLKKEKSILTGADIPEWAVKGKTVYDYDYLEKYFGKAFRKKYNLDRKEGVKKVQAAVNLMKREFGSTGDFLDRVRKEYDLTDKFAKRISTELPYISRKMSAKFKFKFKSKLVDFLDEKKVVKTLSDFDFSDTAKEFTKELRKKDYIPHKLPSDVVERAFNLTAKPGKFFARGRTAKPYNPQNLDDVYKSFIARISYPKVRQHYQNISNEVSGIGFDVVRHLKVTAPETIKAIIDKSKSASILSPAKRANILRTVTAGWIDLVIMGRLPAFALLNTIDDSFRMAASAVDALAEGRRPAWEMVKHFNKYKTPKEVYGKTFASAMAHGDVNRLHAFDLVYNKLQDFGINFPETVRRVGLYKYSFFSHLDKLKRSGVNPTSAVQMARKLGVADVDKWLFDYSRTLLFDQLLGPMAPFVKFYRNNTMLYMNQAVKNPWLVHSMSKAYTALKQVSAEKMPKHLEGFHKIVGETYGNPEFVLSWSPAWEALAKLDDKTLRDIPSRLERKFEKWEGFSEDFKKKMFDNDFEFASYVRSKQLPAVAKFFKVLGEVTPLAPWASLPLGAVGAMEPEFWRGVIPQSHLIHSLTGISLEPWLKENRDKSIKKRAAVEFVGQIMEGKEPDLDKAKESAKSRDLIRSIGKLAWGGWLAKIPDWEIDLYNAHNKLYSKETVIIEPNSEDLQPIMDEYSVGADEAIQIHRQGQIQKSEKIQKLYRQVVLSNYPYLGVWELLKDVDRADERREDMNKEIKKEMRMLERTPWNLKNEVFKGLSFIRGLTLFPNDAIGKKAVEVFINTDPMEWKDKFNKMGSEAKEWLVPILRENSPQWLRELSGDDPNPVPDAIPCLLGNSNDKIYNKALTWLKGLVEPDQLYAASLVDYGRAIAKKVGMSIPTDEDDIKAEKLKARLKQTVNEYKEFNIYRDFFDENNPDLRDQTFAKIKKWYRDIKETDPGLIAYWKDSDYKVHYQVCEGLLAGKVLFAPVPTKVAHQTPEYVTDFVNMHSVDPQTLDPNRDIYENYLKIKDNVYEGRTFTEAALESGVPYQIRKITELENKIKGKVTAKEREAQLVRTKEGLKQQGRGLWSVIKNSGNPGEFVNALYEQDKPLFDSMVENIDEFRPQIEMYKYNNINRGYLRFAESYKFHPSVLDEIPQKAYFGLANLSGPFSRLLNQEGIVPEVALPSFDTVMREKPIPSLDIQPMDQLLKPAPPSILDITQEMLTTDYEPLDKDLEMEELADIPRKPRPEDFSNIVSILHWGRQMENTKARMENRAPTLSGSVGQTLSALGREFKTNPLAVPNLWPLAAETINIGIKAGAFPKDDVPKIQEAVGVTSSVMAGSVIGFKAASVLTNSALGGPIGMAIGALLFGSTAFKGVRDRKKVKEKQKDWAEERRKVYEKQKVERDEHYALQAVKKQAVARDQQTRTAKLAGDMYRRHLAAWVKEGLPMKKAKEQPDWFKKRFMKQFGGDVRKYSKRPNYASKVGLIRTIERAIPRPTW